LLLHNSTISSVTYDCWQIWKLWQAKIFDSLSETWSNNLLSELNSLDRPLYSSLKQILYLRQHNHLRIPHIKISNGIHNNGFAFARSRSCMLLRIKIKLFKNNKRTIIHWQNDRERTLSNIACVRDRKIGKS